MSNQTLARLNNKDKYVTDPLTADDVLDLLEAVNKDEQAEDLFRDAFKATGPFLMMAVHVLV